MACIILGVTGSIAAYKAADIASALVKYGHEVHCVCTAKALEFVTPSPCTRFPATPSFPPLRMKRRTGFPHTSNWPNGRIFCL